jgi:glycerol-3-phosphate acyltransferase PlsX
MVNVILDAMGGDHAPDAILEGAALAVTSGFATADQITLVGREELLRERIDALGLSDHNLSIIDAPEVVEPHESPVEAMRRKPQSSIAIGIGLVKSGHGDAFVSAGSTGVVAAAASLGLGTLEGIRRPGIAISLQGEKGPVMIVDVGANPQPKPLHLQQYAIMGAAYYQDTFGKESPRVGLMNIGSEAKKGNTLILESAELIKNTSVNFVGNIEGVDLFHGKCDVVVCDGFTGNVIIKVSEGLAEYMLRAMGAMMTEVAGEEIASKVVARMLPKVDYSAYGGALLLGTNGVVTICHGRSTAPAISNAIRVAHRAAGANVNQHIVTMAREASPAT